MSSLLKLALYSSPLMVEMLLKKGQQEYSANNKIGKVESMILHVVSVIDHLKELQLSHLRTSEITIRKNKNERFDEKKMMSTYIIAMDNYFTLPSEISVLQDKEIGIVGTAPFHGKTCPPQNLQDISKENAMFNDFYWCVDVFGSLYGRWMNNGIVFVTSTIHRVQYHVLPTRQGRQITQNSKDAGNKIWRDQGKVDIHIPTLITIIGWEEWMCATSASPTTTPPTSSVTEHGLPSSFKFCRLFKILGQSK